MRSCDLGVMTVCLGGLGIGLARRAAASLARPAERHAAAGRVHFAVPNRAIDSRSANRYRFPDQPLRHS
jgi:hypothetical protein